MGVMWVTPPRPGKSKNRTGKIQIQARQKKIFSRLEKVFKKDVGIWLMGVMWVTPPRPGKSKWGMNSRVYFIAVSSKKHYH
jgi:hypothetical protein